MTITLEGVKAEQEKLAKMIAELEAKAARTICFPEIKIELREGEQWAGIAVDTIDGKLEIHHLILLPSEESGTWSAMIDWAVKAGGDLPTRREQSLLYAKLKDQFKPEWHWSSEQHAGGSDYALCQYFFNGGQYNNRKGNCLRARAVRRLVIQ